MAALEWQAIEGSSNEGADRLTAIVNNVAQMPCSSGFFAKADRRVASK
jgi:hypothetical protein